MKTLSSRSAAWTLAGLLLTGAVVPVGAAPAAGPVLLVVTGLGGEPRFDERFHTWAATLLDAAEERGFRRERLLYLAADPGRDPGRTSGRATRDEVRATLGRLVDTSPDLAPVFVVVLGHGSFRDGVTRVNLPGPDMTAEDFADALAPFGERPVVFAALTSASGGLVPVLAAPGRVVIAATRSGTERNASLFGQFFAAAFVGDAADADNDGRLSVREAFDYARAEVERGYGREQKLLTEHAVLEDADGLAATLFFEGGGEARASGTSELRAEKSRLEAAVAALRQRKAELSPEDYEARLEELLVELALANRALRALRFEEEGAEEGAAEDAAGGKD